MGNRRARIAIDGPIGYWDISARDFREALDSLGEVDEIEVIVNSPGGSVGAGVAIYSALKRHSARIITSIEGYALSMGSVIAMAGDVVQMSSASVFMIHDPWSMAMGSAEEMRKEAEVLDVHKQALVNAYSLRAGVTEEAAAELMTAETWMDSNRALELGFIDSVFDAPEEDENEEDDSATAMGLTADEMSEYLTRLGGNAPAWAREQINSFTTARAARVVSMAQAENPMPDKKKTGSAVEGAENENDANAQAVADAEARGAEAGATAERNRVAGIRKAFDDAKLPAQFNKARDKAIENGVSLEDFQTTVETLTDCQDATPAGRDASAYAGEDAREKFRVGATAALSAVAGLGTVDRANEYNSMSMAEIARASLIAGNQRPLGSRMDIVAMAFTHSTSDFPHILHDIAHRSLLAAFDEVEETYSDWTSTGNFRDFRNHDRIGWNGFENLEMIKEGGEYKNDTFDDYKESASIDTHGKMFNITRQAIINDDIGVFSQIPRMFGEAARRTLGAKVIEILVTNPKMGDGVAMIHATHGNLNATGAAISTDSVSAIRRAMALNKGRRTQDDAQPSGIRPNILLCPLSLEDRAMVLAASETYVEAGPLADSYSRMANSVRNTFKVVADPRLDQISTTDWYMISNTRPPIEVGFLDGNQTPYLEAKNGWRVDGVEWKVRLDAGINALEYMTIYKQAGV